MIEDSKQTAPADIQFSEEVSEMDQVKQNNFTPKMVGPTDLEKHEKIHALYSDLCKYATGFAWEIQNLLRCEKPEQSKAEIALTEENDYCLPINVLEDLIKINQKDLPLFLKRLYVETNNISIHGINNEKLINSDWLDLPGEYETIISTKEAIDGIISEIRSTHFSFPFNKLYNKEIDEFCLTEEFEQELHLFTTVYTTSAEQNKILDVVQSFADSMNKLIELGLLKTVGNSWVNVADSLEDALSMDRKANQLVINKLLFKRGKFRRFADPNTLKFTPSVPGKIFN